MNIFQHYKRAVTLSKNTSRMTNPDWYKGSLELDTQLHLYIGQSNTVNVYLFIKSANFYEKLTSVKLGDLTNQGAVEQLVDSLLQREGLKQTKSLGVVLYIADELAIASLGPEHQNPAELDELKERIIREPSEVLEDTTVSLETHSWRIFPYMGAVSGSEFATAVVISRKHAKIAATFREIGDDKNLPIVTSVLSAPICAVASMPWFSTVNEKGIISVYNYTNFTLLAFFNSAGELMMLRNMPHPSGSDFPVNIGSAITATSSAFELESPEINVVSLVNNDTGGLITSIQRAMSQSDIMLIDAREILISRQLPSDIPLEMLVATQEFDTAVSGLASNTTFTDLKDNKWHLQEFILPPNEELEMFPSWSDMKLLRVGKVVKLLGGVAAVISIAWCTFSVWSKQQSDVWKFKPADQKANIASLNKQLSDYKHYDNLLKDRSKAWVCMEFLTKIAPAGSEIYLKDVKHDIKQETGNNKAAKIGLKKTWAITGYTNENGLSYLESISTKDKIKLIFNEVAEVTGNRVYITDLTTREVFVELRNSTNRNFQSGDLEVVGYNSPLTFSMDITQIIMASDEMAVVSTK